MLPLEEWLPKAKAMCIGGHDRFFHRREKRPNLVIWNKPDAWTAYCQACKEGGVVKKEHVLYGVASPEANKSILTLPCDLQRQSQWDDITAYSIGQFLASKGMDYKMLPEMFYSCTRKRLCIQTEQGWMGRDVTGRALDKWLTYNGQHYLYTDRGSDTVVMVEDSFSYFKVLWAVPELNVLCCLGTGLKPSIIARCMNMRQAILCFDGDQAGYKGATAGAQRLRAIGVFADSRCAPEGKDPKDLSAASLCSLIFNGVHV